MKSPKFELGKLARMIEWKGLEYTFTLVSETRNEWNEIVTGTTQQALKGIFHQTSSFVTLTTATGSQMTRKPQPMILAKYEDAKTIKMDSELVIGDCTYKVVEVTNLNNLNIIADISLEVIR